MVRMAPEFLRHNAHELVFNGAHGAARRKPGSIGDAKDVRIHCNGRLTEGDIQHHIGSLPADTG